MTFHTQGYRVRITNTAPTTGNFTDNNPATGYGTFTANVVGITNGDKVPYYAWDGGANYEEGYLTYNSGSPSTLSRTVVRSTNSNLACNFSGVVYISFGIHDANAVMTDDSGNLIAANSYNIALAGNLTIASASLIMSGSISAPAWTTGGIREKFTAGTLTDTTSPTGPVAAAYTSVRGGNTIAATNTGVVYTNYYELYVKAPVAGSHVTLTNGWAVGCDSLYAVTTLQGPDAGQWTASGLNSLTKLGVGMVATNLGDFRQDQNGNTTVSLKNGDTTHTAAVTRYYLDNASTFGQIALFGASYTTSGVFQGNYTYLVAGSGAGIVAQSGPILIAANGTTEVARFTTGGGLVLNSPANISQSAWLTIWDASGSDIVFLRSSSSSNNFINFISTNTSATAARFQCNGALVGSITLSTGSTTYNTTSDEHVKCDWRGLTSDEIRQRLSALYVAEHSWVNDPSLPRAVNFKAQQGHGVHPQAFLPGLGGSTWMRAVGELEPLLTLGWQDHETRIVALEKKLKKAA